jgi:hydroxyethylthiazole kinase-like sugar kinase family protein
LSNGNAFNDKVTGLGCSATVLTGAYWTIEDPFEAVVMATVD